MSRWESRHSQRGGEHGQRGRESHHVGLEFRLGHVLTFPPPVTSSLCSCLLVCQIEVSHADSLNPNPDQVKKGGVTEQNRTESLR